MARSARIRPGTGGKLGLATVERGGKNWLAVPYVDGEDTINHKYRLTSEKDHRMDEGAPLALWNVNTMRDPKVRDGQAPLVITEGNGCDGSHPERVAIHGQRSERRAERGNQRLDGAKRYDWIDRHADDLRKCVNLSCLR